MQSVEYAVIAAAGLGSRLGHGLPKCMLEIGGRPLLSRLIETLEKQVARIHVVIGYREELVIALCASMHRNVVLVRNPDFRTTSTVQSMALGARGCEGKTLFLDGDLIIEPSSLRNFIAEAEQHSVLAAIALSRSENPVNVRLSTGPEPTSPRNIVGFTREVGLAYEWANVVAGPAQMLDNAVGYVYEVLENFIPLPALEMELREVDTSADLDLARSFAQKVDHRAI